MVLLALATLCTPRLARAGSDEMASAAKAFWQSLDPQQQAKAMFDLKDAERENWHYIPKPRKGLPFKEMTEPQRELARTFLKTGLSAQGYDKAEAIMNDLEPVLREQEHSDTRDATLYYFSLFGKPDAAGTWGWRVEGHHVSLNFTIVDGKPASASPEFLGANPANVLNGPHKGLRVLAQEEDLGRQLVKSFDESQHKLAVLSESAPKEITTGNQRKIDPKTPTGISYAQMNDAQKKMLKDLLDVYANRLRAELAEQDLKKIEAAGIDKVCFAWEGGTDPGEGHYYRIQGPTFMIEYDNTQNKANHIHTVWRDPVNDFGEDSLAEHYKSQKHE
jgi:hypothetical protein